MDIRGTVEEPRMLIGIRRKLVMLRINLRIFTIALQAYHSPLVAIQVLRSLIAKKQAIIGHVSNLRLVRANGRYFWSIAATGYPSLAFDTLIRNELNKIRPFLHHNRFLQSIIFSITARCPLKCDHCYEWNNLSQGEFLSLDELKLILHKVQDYGVTNIQLSGGEPLTRFDDLIALLEYARPGTDFWILTSGFGFTSEKAERLRDAGLAGVVISLDHHNEQAHNLFRHNENSYRWVLEAAQNARKAGLVVAFSLCASREFVSPENLQRYMLLAKRCGASMVRILEPRKVGHYEGKEIELDARQTGMLTVCYLRNIHEPSMKAMPIIEYSGYYQRKYGCFGAGDRSLYIDSKGDVHGCPFCHGAVGNALTDSLPSLVQKLRDIGCHKYPYQMSESEIIHM